MAKTSDAQKRAIEEYRKRNREKTRIDGYRRTARLFIRSHATEEDLQELEKLIKERRKMIDESAE
ncbi:hypothetical protein [Murdochiella massiliensis]|uniref:hypothetical protein n=1 Tax=Murdochiella massiliensis TaxID=1673723 RepID=UPI00082CE213|nr:hypothetical protein [Murdochiella massiliensis]